MSKSATLKNAEKARLKTTGVDRWDDPSLMSDTKEEGRECDEEDDMVEVLLVVLVRSSVSAGLSNAGCSRAAMSNFRTAPSKEKLPVPKERFPGDEQEDRTSLP